MTSSEERRISVLAIAGTGQNGATLLSRMLGELPGMVAVGELGRIWDKGLIEDQPCSCGVAFGACPFWIKVGEEGFGGWSNVDGYEAARARETVRLKRRLRRLPDRPVPELRQIGSLQVLPFLLFPRVWPEYRRNMRRYIELMERLYRGILSASGADVIVDSMKVPYHVFLLRRMAGVDLRVLHLVRDSRGVAHSNTKQVRKQSERAGKVYRGTKHPAKSAWRWSWINVSFDLLRRMGSRVTRVRYEAVVRAPSEELLRMLAATGWPADHGALGFIQGDELHLPAGHLVAGNRMRLESGPVRLRTDEKWRAELPRKHQRLVGALTRPLLARYGYRAER